MRWGRRVPRVERARGGGGTGPTPGYHGRCGVVESEWCQDYAREATHLPRRVGVVCLHEVTMPGDIDFIDSRCFLFFSAQVGGGRDVWQSVCERSR